MAQSRQLVLASSSRYRRELLARFGLAFDCADPGIEESATESESPPETALRLALLKAQAVAPRFAAALIVGSDQVASLGGRRLGKPGNHAGAARQLRDLSGKAAQFHTAVCVLDARSGAARAQVVPCRVQFRAFDERRIEAYLRREQPYDCAGSARAEGLGIALIERIETDDPTALIGLPLIALAGLLEQAGLPVIGE